MSALTPSATGGNLRRAVEWLGKAADVDPYDTGVALELVRALAAAGDRGGDLAVAHRHEDLSRQDLEVEPDGKFIETVARLR